MSNPTLTYRPELPADMPPGIAALPIHRGYPVPWFVESVKGVPDFRVMKGGAVAKAAREQRCWVCGRPRLHNSLLAYVSGPMCGINRNTAEPPCHVSCADWSARACPFLTRPHAKRREAGLPEGASIPGAIHRNPGVAMVWITRLMLPRIVGGHAYFDLGAPAEVRWYCEGRPATRAEVMESVDSGKPLLAEQCRGDEDIALLDKLYEQLLRVVPKA